MAGSNLPKGLIVDLITPVLPGGAIDGTGLGRHLDRLLPCVQAVCISGPNTGEGARLSIEQRADLFDKTLVVVRGVVPLLVWITGDSEDNTLKNLDLFRKKQSVRNYQGTVIWVDTPLYYHSNRNLPEYYRKLCSQIDESLILHNDPALICTLNDALKRKNIRTAILKELAENPGIGGLIFSGSLDRSYNYQRAVKSRKDFRIYDEDETRFLDSPGLSGVVSTGANIAPREWSKITASSLSRNNEDAYPDQQQQIWNTWSYLSDLKSMYAGNRSAILKKVISDMGIIAANNEYETPDVVEAAEKIKKIMGLSE